MVYDYDCEHEHENRQSEDENDVQNYTEKKRVSSEKRIKFPRCKRLEDE